MPEIFEPVEEVAQDAFVPVSEVGFEPVEEVTVNRQPFLPEPGTTNIGREPLSRTPTQAFPTGEQNLSTIKQFGTERQRRVDELPSEPMSPEEQKRELTGILPPEPEIQPFGKEGSFLRGASSVVASVANRPEYLAAMLNPATATAVGLYFASQIAKQFFEDFGKAQQGDNEALGRAAMIGIPALVGGVKVGKTIGERLKFQTELERAQSASSASHIDEMARLGMNPTAAQMQKGESPLISMRPEAGRPELLTPKAEELPQTDIESVFELNKLDEEVNATLAQGIREPSTLAKIPEVPVAHETVLPGASETFKAITEVPEKVTPLTIALEAQREAGWNTKWPFVPADLLNADFRKAILEDPSLSESEKSKIFIAGEKLGVIPSGEIIIGVPNKPLPLGDLEKGVERAREIESAAALHGNDLRVGEGPRGTEEAGQLAVNEGGEGVRGNEVQEPPGAQEEVAPTEKFEPVEEVPKEQTPKEITTPERYPASPVGSVSTGFRITGGDKFSPEERITHATQQRSKLISEAKELRSKSSIAPMTGAAFEVRNNRALKARRLQEIKAQVTAWDAEIANAKSLQSKESTPSISVEESTPVQSEETGPGMVGMGGALEGEVKTGAGEDIFGISQRVREKMAETGRFPYTSPGQGTTAWEQIQRGRQLIREGAKPDDVLANFERTKRISADDMAVIRAHMENLYQQARSIESKKGTESPEYLAKQQELNNWWQRTKPMQTEWHKMGEAQQGSTDIDTGDLVSLEAAHQKATGKGFTPKQTTEAKGVADSVKEARDAARVAQQKVIDSIDKEVEKGPQYEPRVLKMAEDFATYMDKKAESAILRLRERLKNVGAGVDPTIISDLAIVGAAKITRGIVDFAKWSDAMIRDLGEDVKPFLKDAYEASKKDFDEELNTYSAKVKGATGEQVKAAVKSKAPKAPATIEATRKAVAPDKSGKITPDQVKTVWNYAKEKYINKGEGNLDAIAQGVADDLGLPKKTVMQTMAGNKGTRQLTDEMYLKLSRQRQAEAAARSWLINQQTPGWIRAVRKVPRFFFAAKVFGHGTVGMVTHAGVLMFDPVVAKQYWTNFAKQYGLAYKKGYHEAMMQDLLHRPNFAMARRAGLANDPFRFQDDYQNPAIQMGLGWFTKAGNRGFDSLKLLRQDLFDKAWGGLDDAIKTPKMAKMLADDINHATGIITSKLPGKLGEAAAVAMFAPKLEASRWAWAIGDPARAAKTLANWKNEGPEARMQAIGEIKQKARIAGTYFALLAINQGLNSAFGNGDQTVNVDNPHRGDFLAFKMFGQEVSVVSPMLHMVGVLADLYRISRSEDRGKLEKLSSRRDEAGTRIWQYAQGKASPFAQPMLDLAFQTDFQGRPMPYSEDKMPKWLRREGLERYTWPEYIMQVMAPIPVAEAIKEVWDSQGMDDSKMETALKALTAFTVTGGTGIRVKTDKRAGE